MKLYNVHFQLAKTWDDLMRDITDPPYGGTWSDDVITNLNEDELTWHMRNEWRRWYDKELRWLGTHDTHVFYDGKGWHGMYKYAIVIIEEQE